MEKVAVFILLLLTIVCQSKSEKESKCFARDLENNLCYCFDHQTLACSISEDATAQGNCDKDKTFEDERQKFQTIVINGEICVHMRNQLFGIEYQKIIFSHTTCPRNLPRCT